MDKTSDDSVFVEFFGAYPIVSVMGFLLEHQFFEYSIREIAGYTGIGISTIYTFWDKLEKVGFVKISRQVGKANMYVLNRDSQIVKDLAKFTFDLALSAVPKTGKKRMIEA